MARLRTMGPGGQDDEQELTGGGGLGSLASLMSETGPDNVYNPGETPKIDWELGDKYAGGASYSPRESFGPDVSRVNPTESRGEYVPGEWGKGGQSATSPRESFGGVGGEMGGGGGGALSAPPRPRQPQPTQGGVSEQPGVSMRQAPMVSPPMPGQPIGMMARNSGGLYGSMGGLKGGGLGVPFDPTSNAQSDPISSLIQMLLQNRR